MVNRVGEGCGEGTRGTCRPEGMKTQVGQVQEFCRPKVPEACRKPYLAVSLACG